MYRVPTLCLALNDFHPSNKTWDYSPHFTDEETEVLKRLSNEPRERSEDSEPESY